MEQREMLPVRGDTVLLDSSFIVSGSVHIVGLETPKHYALYNNSIVWTSYSPKDTVIVKYKKLKFSIAYEHKDKKLVHEIYEKDPFRYVPNKQFGATEYGTLKTAGNVSRGIGFGNAQDVVVNSNLNLRINGKLANDVEILAVISDENNPIQPEGNTQQIQDFDQVYITLKKDSSKLTMGDFLMKKPTDSYFINYYKKSRGLQFTNIHHNKKWRISTQAEAAMSRGRFSRNKIDGIEGNSGPYRLSGDNGELFIIIIAGTENVFLDGRKMTRGEDNDYVINYNTGEITFTPRILITRYSRIVAEFQYSDRNYGRSVAHLGTALTKGRFTLYANAFNEMDLRSQNFQQSLDGYDSSLMKSAYDILDEAGDSLAYFSNARELDAYTNERIVYNKVLIGPQEVFVYASDPNSSLPFYQVNYSNVGQGRGDYRQAQTAANGKVFEYIGGNMGDYAPIEILIAPKSLNSVNVGMVIKQEGRQSGIEYSISSMDDNTLSKLDDEDNTGFGVKLYQTTEKQIRDSSPWKWSTNLNYELVSGGYNYVERYRAVEFDRKWTKVIANPTSLAQYIPSFEHIANAQFGLKKSESTFISNSSSYFLRPGNFSGFSNISSGGFEWKKVSISSRLELMNSESTQNDSSSLNNSFYGLHALAQRPIGKVLAGIAYGKESSVFKADSLLGTSYGFETYKAFIRSTDSSKLSYDISAAQRTDQLPKNEGFSVSTIGRDISLSSSYKSPKSQRIEFGTIYRQLQVRDTLLSNKPVENTLQSRLELNLHFFKKFIRTRTFYQVGTGQEQRREFQYLNVQSGNGVYVWNDYDSNGIKTLNEFEVASDLDRQRADYIKIYTPVAGFISTNSSKISQTIELNPSVFYNIKKRVRPFPARFNSLTTLILDKKILPTEILNFLNPLQRNLEDTSLINNSQNFRSTLFYNRGNSKYSVDYTYINSNSKVLLTNGFDSRSSNDNMLNTRVNLGRKFTLNTRLVLGERLYQSQFFVDNNYKYTFYEIVPQLQVVIKKMYRIALMTKYYNAVNSELFGGETSENVEIGTAFKYAKANKGTMSAGFNYIKVNYDGSASSNLGYELLRGLQKGNNVTCKFGYQRTLANNIQLMLSYDGRQSEDAPVIHMGRLLARYLF